MVPNNAEKNNVFGVRGGLELTLFSLDGRLELWKFQGEERKKEEYFFIYGSIDTSKLFTLPGSRYLDFDRKLAECNITSYCKCSSSIDQNPCHHRR